MNYNKGINQIKCPFCNNTERIDKSVYRKGWGSMWCHGCEKRLYMLVETREGPRKKFLEYTYTFVNHLVRDEYVNENDNHIEYLNSIDSIFDK